MSGLHLVTEYEDGLELLRWLGERRPEEVIALDVETGGLDWHRNRLRTVQFGDGDTGWCVPWDEWRGLVRAILTRWRGDWVGHNVRFDWKFLEGPQGFAEPMLRTGTVHDTMIQASLVEPNRAKSLDFLAARWVHSKKQGRRLKDAMDRGGWNYDTVPIHLPEYWQYAAADTVLTARLFPVLRERVASMGSADAYELEREAAVVCLRMEQRGVRVDLDYCRRKAAELRVFADRTAQWARDRYGVTNIGSNDQVIARLRRDGVTLTKTTASGAKMALDEEVLEQESVQAHPLAKAVAGHRKAIKLASAYFENFLEMAVGDRLYPSINTVAARTGRMSITNPAAQTLPTGPIVRDAIIADEGCLIVAVDYQGMEARMLAHIANEENLIAVCRAYDEGRGLDIHSATAQLVYRLGDQAPTKAQRSTIKNAGFAVMYGAGVKKFALMCGLPEEQARVVYDQYLETYPGIRRLQKETTEAVTETAKESYDGKTGWIKQEDGRVHPIEVDRAYTAINYLIQGGCCSVFKKALIDVSRAGYGERLLLPVHDEIVAQGPEEHAVDVARGIAQNMQRLDLRCPLVVSFEAPARTWGEAK